MFLKLFTLFLITLLILPNPVSGEEFQDIFCILNESVWTGDWTDMKDPYTPQKNVIREKHTYGWMDITGYDREVMVDNITFVYGEPLQKNYNKLEILPTLPFSKHYKRIIIGGVVIFYDSWHIKVLPPNMYIDRVTHFSRKLYVSKNHTHINAQLIIKMVWRKECSRDGSRVIITTRETIILRDSIERPLVYPSLIENNTIDMTEYENNISNYSLIKIPPQDGVVITNFSYKNNSVLRVNKLGLIREGVDGNLTLQFLNDTQAWIVDANQSVIGSHDGGVVIHETPVNLSLLNVTLSSPYESLTINNYNTTCYHADPGEVFNAKSLYWFLPCIILLWGISKIYTTITNSIGV